MLGVPDRFDRLLADAELGMNGPTIPTVTPTDQWLACVDDIMPALTGPAGTAERLLPPLHYGIDWEGGRIPTHLPPYWGKQLPDRRISSTYRAGGNLRRWWSLIAEDITSTPRNTRQRQELVQLLTADPGPVLAALRLETDALLLRVRIVTEAVRATRTTDTTPAANVTPVKR